MNARGATPIRPIHTTWSHSLQGQELDRTAFLAQDRPSDPLGQDNGGDSVIFYLPAVSNDHGFPRALPCDFRYAAPRSIQHLRWRWPYSGMPKFSNGTMASSLKPRFIPKDTRRSVATSPVQSFCVAIFGCESEYSTDSVRLSSLQKQENLWKSLQMWRDLS